MIASEKFFLSISGPPFDLELLLDATELKSFFVLSYSPFMLGIGLLGTAKFGLIVIFLLKFPKLFSSYCIGVILKGVTLNELRLLLSSYYLI